MAAKKIPQFTCTACGVDQLVWLGRCDACDHWGTIEPRARVADQQGGPVLLAALEEHDAKAQATGLTELDRVLGGGLMPGSVTLLAGEPGIGKSTLALQLLGSAHEGPVMLVAGEESAEQIAGRAKRLGIERSDLYCVPTRSLEVAIEAVLHHGAKTVVVDSVQTLGIASVPGSPGSVSQVREVTEQFVALAKRDRITVIILGHVTKDGSPGGPRTLEHLVDSVLLVEGDRVTPLRSVHALKHRFGPTGELGILSLGSTGLVDSPDAGSLVLSDRIGGPGSVLVPTVLGARARVVELQALVSSSGSSGRRLVTGFDSGRLNQILGICEQRLGLGLGSSDLYCSVAGGSRVVEPAADLGLALAIVGALTATPSAPRAAVIGELGLMGELRQVDHLEARIAEALRLGLGPIIVPRGLSKHENPAVRPVSSLSEAVNLLTMVSPSRQAQSA
ncbi:MAG: ATPase domain-containing protein [Actinomycetota bacterium]